MRLNRVIFQLVSIGIVSMGFAQLSVAGVVNSGQLINAEARSERITSIEALLARADVADQLVKFGVSPEVVSQRVRNMTDEELVTLESNMKDHIAGADAIGIIGTVFLVLLILELLGVTDVFTAI